MGKKHYSQSIKDEAVLFYELGHSFAETQAKYGMAESTFFTWKQKFDKAHPMHEAITTNRTTCHKSKRHLEKLALELEVLRQCPCGRNASIDEKVAAVNALRGRYSIHVLCDALSLPRGTYYNRKRRAGQRTSYEINDEKLKPLIRQIFHDSKNRFGRKPIHHKLAKLGYKVSEKRIVRLMKEMGLSVAKPCYKAEHQKSLPRAYFRNLLARQFDQPQPNLIWVSDITYIKVLDQYYYICVVLDLFSRRILSYSISDSINTALTLAAFDDAFQSRNPPQDLMFHSDQGAQYTSYIFRAHLKELHIKQSFSTPGTPYDNSVCESFFHTLKKEALYHHLYGTPQELQAVLDEYINFYNSQRPHRKLNMKRRTNMNRRSILAAYKKKSSHLQTGVTGFKSGNLFKFVRYNAVLLGLVVLCTNARNRFCPMCTKGCCMVPTCSKPFGGSFGGKSARQILIRTNQINAQLWSH